MKGFIEFIREQGVVGLAVGFILGGAVSKLVASLVADIIQPVIGMILGSTEGLAAMTAGPIAYGSFIATLIDFAIIAFVVYAVFSKIAAKMDKKK
jgi:large conductance mechanosensitive channel